jgi:Beta-lactamase enzyme family
MLSRRSLLAGAVAVAAAPMLFAGRAVAAESVLFPVPAAAAVPMPFTGRAVAAESIDWFDWLARHRGNIAVFADDGRGHRIAYRECRLSPLASAYKAIHAATFAGSGINPQRQIKIRDWEAYYLPGTDGGVHPQALQWLGIPVDGPYAKDPDQLVPLDAVARAMIVWSDNAAADYLHDLLGVPALRRTAACGGWPNAQVPALIGQWLRIWWPGTNDDLARRYLTDPQFRAATLAKQAPGLDEVLAWAKTTHRGSAADLASLHRAIATERIPGRNYLELAFAGLRQPDELGIGFKGGEVPGVLTVGFSLRRDDGTIGTIAVLVSDLAADDYLALHANEVDFILVCLGLLRDPAAFHHVGKVLGHA